MSHSARSSRLLALAACVVVLAAGACQPSGASAPAPAASKPPAAGSADSSARPESQGAGASSAAAAPQPAPLKPLKIQVSTKSAAFAFLYVTKVLGLFEQHGLDAELVIMSGSVGIAALQANELDFMAAVGSATRAAVRGLPLRVVYVEATGPDQVLVGSKANRSALQTKRDQLRAGLQPVVAGSEALRTQRDRVLPIIAREYELSLEDAAEVYTGLQAGWTTDGKPSAAAVRFEFEMDQREMELAEPIRPEQVFDFSLLDEVRARWQ